MSSMSASKSQARFFGMDLGGLGQDLLTAWRGMLDWPLVSWLWPTSAVRLWLPAGGQALSRSLNAPFILDESRARAARFQAVLLPESLLLRRTLNLPPLQSAELQAALGLEIQALSPFPVGDLVWVHEISPNHGSQMQAHLVLTSRRLIDQHVATLGPQFASQLPEMWVPSAIGPGFAVLPGFGEARRQRQGTAWRWASALLALVVMALGAALAVTPTVQLYLRSAQASQALAALQKKAGPVLAQRESLVRTTEQLDGLAKLAGKPIPPLQALSLVTETLPDDTSLLGLQVQGLKVSITGQTGNAAALMKLLGSTPGLRDVKAPTPATKPLGAPKESFTIEFTMDPAQLRPAS